MYKASGFIIKKEDKGENDKVLTIFSHEYGKIRVVAKGVRKNKSKLASHLELFSFVSINFVLGKSFKVLTSALEGDCIISKDIDFDKKKVIYNIMELINRYTLPDHKDKALIKLLIISLDYLKVKDLNELELKYFLRYFEYRFLELLGYKPEEKEVEDFFSSKSGVVDRDFLDNLEFILLRYFKNIL